VPYRWDVGRFLEAAKLLASSSQRNEVNQLILEAIEENLAPSSWFLFLMLQDKAEMLCELAVGKHAQEFKNARVRVGQGIAGWVAEHSEPLALSSFDQTREYFSEIEEMKRLEGSSVVAIPLLIGEECVGVLQLIDAGFDASRKSNMAALQEFASHVATAIEAAEHQCKITELAIVDDPTGLYKARCLDFILDTELNRSAQFGYEFALAVLECGNLRDIVSSLRSDAVHRLLNELGDLIKGCLRRVDWAFYLGDGKFAVVFPQAARNDAHVVAHRMRGLIESTAFLAPDLNIRLVVATGIATCPTNALTKGDLIRLAEDALQ
jgi:diguanylate cyclase (GGDEF)-like protein